jgi:hypothetical protein
MYLEQSPLQTAVIVPGIDSGKSTAASMTVPSQQLPAVLPGAQIIHGK